MTYDPSVHHRRSIRLRHHDYSAAGTYFLTLCASERECLFGDIVDGRMHLNSAGEIVQEFWNHLPARFANIELDAFVVMPNHIHGILVIANGIPVTDKSPDLTDRIARRRMLLPEIVGYFRMNTGKCINDARDARGTAVWQRNYWEHIIRDELELDRIRKYIEENPFSWEHDDLHPTRPDAA